MNRKPETKNRQSSDPLDVSALRLHSIHERRHIAQIDSFARTPEPGTSFSEWLASLPDFLGAQRLRAAVDAIVAARRAEYPVVFAMGGHVVKVGCAPVIIDLMRRGIVTAIACHGATAIHDVEVAMVGATSEDVGDTIRDGRFGMVRETAEFFAEAARKAAEGGSGYGASLGRLIRERRLPHAALSLLAAAAELDLPATVHVALGTDTVHMPSLADGAHIGAATMTDFRILCQVVCAMGRGEQMERRRDREIERTGEGEPDAISPSLPLSISPSSSPPGQISPSPGLPLSPSPPPGGVWCNIGSAVLLPEVFLKAVSVARNLGADLDTLTTINMDQIRHYRPAQNVTGRPVTKGRGLDLAGHHEILLPLLRQAIIELYPEVDNSPSVAAAPRGGRRGGSGRPPRRSAGGSSEPT